MQKNGNKEFDLMVREALEGAEERVSPRVWKSVRSRLGISPARTVRYWAAPAMAFAAAAAVTLTVIRPSSADIDDSLAALTEVPTEAVMQPVPEEEITLPAESAENGQAAVKQTTSASRAEAETKNVASEPQKEEAPVQVAAKEPQASHNDCFTDPFAEDASEAARKFRKASLSIRGLAGGNDDNLTQSGTRPQYASGGHNNGTVIEHSQSIYGIPVCAGVELRLPVSKRFCLGTGIDWSFITRTFAGEALTESGDFTHNMHYIGIPLNVYYNAAEAGRCSFYLMTGGSVQKCVSNRYYLYERDTKPIYKSKVDGVMFECHIGAGVNFNITDRFALFASPDICYYFPGNQPKSIRTDKPLMINFEFGVNFTL